MVGDSLPRVFGEDCLAWWLCRGPCFAGGLVWFLHWFVVLGSCVVVWLCGSAAFMVTWWILNASVAIFVPISSGTFVVGIWDPGGDRAFTVVEPYFAEFTEHVMEANLKGSPNSPDVFTGTFVGLVSNKRSYYDALLLEVRTKRLILITPALSVMVLD
ncbi:hypothetical protein L3X38_018568 [Prunus dulcis]|uniref:Uncharacterized protein n=1 Tax=Prunus dulcis TaxID=3755 RepID=A0AAD4WA01_PRUDU|nr:hypothetical protein L3X38_018568 [Prunus dulcis]